MIIKTRLNFKQFILKINFIISLMKIIKFITIGKTPNQYKFIKKKRKRKKF